MRFAEAFCAHNARCAKSLLSQGAVESAMLRRDDYGVCGRGNGHRGGVKRNAGSPGISSGGSVERGAPDFIQYGLEGGEWRSAARDGSAAALDARNVVFAVSLPIPGFDGFF